MHVEVRGQLSEEIQPSSLAAGTFTIYAISPGSSVILAVVVGGDGMYMLHNCVYRCACMCAQYVMKPEVSVGNFPLLFFSCVRVHVHVSLNLELTYWLEWPLSPQGFEGAQPFSRWVLKIPTQVLGASMVSTLPKEQHRQQALFERSHYEPKLYLLNLGAEHYIILHEVAGIKPYMMVLKDSKGVTSNVNESIISYNF